MAKNHEAEEVKGNGVRKFPAVLERQTQHVHITDPTELKLWPDLTRKRNIYVCFDIDDELAHEVIQSLHWCDYDNPKLPVNIYLSTPGGEVFAGLAIFDTIRNMKAPTRTVAIGWTASMGGILLQAGQMRYMTEHSWLMLHEVKTVFGEGSTSKIQDEAILMRQLQEKFLSILSERSRMTRKQIEENWKRRDFWLDAQTALRHGFCDGILGSRRPRKPRR